MRLAPSDRADVPTKLDVFVSQLNAQLSAEGTSVALGGVKTARRSAIELINTKINCT